MTPMIEAAGVVKRFGKTTALDGLNLLAEQGAILAVLGPNGAGKTTFVRCIATLIEPDSGTLRVFGHDVVREAHSVRSSIGLAGQLAAVEPAMTGRENLEMVARLFGQDRARARANSSRVLEQIGLVEDALRPPRLDEVFLALTDRAPDWEPVDDAVATATVAGFAEPAPSMREETHHG